MRTNTVAAQVSASEGRQEKSAFSSNVEGGVVAIRIADNGTGIPKQIQDKVFDPFFTTKVVGRGTGQGLSIARSIVVDAHGGTLSFETELGRGIAFTIRLPIDGQRQLAS